MKLVRTFWATATLVVSSHALADTVSDAKAYFEKGLRTYVESGPRALIESFTKNGALEGNTQALSQANVLQQLQDLGGKPTSYEIVSVTKLSERSVEILYVVNLDKIEIFGNAHVYKTTAGPYTTAFFNFNTQPEKVWPQSRVYGAP
jgi:hypothetical protein